MSDVVVRAEGLSKRYRIGTVHPAYRTLRDSLSSALSAPFRRHTSSAAGGDVTPAKAKTIWALRDVSFELRRGEVLGIIGSNGAGKSTLLKILSRITKPTSGWAEINGQVGSLLEVGTGFHPELTGRENVYLNGAILGMRRAEIERRFDEIVAFAEIETFLDTPVKHYSSGMYVRLAFAVAAHLEPEILIVDEVLAVGDAAFQKKCLGKMGEAGRQGRTVIFVSHNLQAVSALTRRALVLDGGQLIHAGETSAALERYRALWTVRGASEYTNPGSANGITRAKVITSGPRQVHRAGEPLVFEFDLRLPHKLTSATFSFQVNDEEMRPITHLWIEGAKQPWSRPGGVRLRCHVPKSRLYMGRYSLTTYLSDRTTFELYEKLDGICAFEVVMDGTERGYEWKSGACTFLEDAEWSVY
jgi:lipopolysaccharide transport system ATP-binding protein